MGVLAASTEKTKLLNKEEKPPETKLKYPKSIFFILGNEFCERFTYYGLRTILTLYFVQRLSYSETTATVYYHSFILVAYFTPLLGAIIADSLLGKFRTILYLSIVYCIGCIILSIGAYPHDLNTMVTVSLIGLLLIAFGTGGIKPCVSAFGGDQFKEGQESQREKFFYVFYLSINLGSLISTWLTPVLREDVHCFGEKSCYSLAFGVPAALMIIALLLFICGKPFYTIRPPSGNIAIRVTKCICYAIGKKFKSSEKKKSHWLDYAEDKFDKGLIDDIKILLHVLVLYIPLPFFWALYDQQGSRWILQATRMDGKLDGFHIKPDQMQVINPALIVILIPIFNYIVYPILDKCRILKTPLQRMTAGGILTAISFFVAGFIELSLEKDYPVLPHFGNSQLTIINNSPCTIKIDGVDMPSISAFESAIAPEIPLGTLNDWKFDPKNCSATKQGELIFNSSTSIETMMITLKNDNLKIIKSNDTKTKSKDGEPQVRIFYNIDSPKNSNVSFLIKSPDNEIIVSTGTQEEHGMTEYVKFTPGKYAVYLPYNETDYQDTPVIEKEFKSGGIYILNIFQKSNVEKFLIHEMVKGNELSILFQLPQLIIITAGEIMFSVTGLEFSYSQSPNSMKSVIQAIWLLTVSLGNVIVMIVAELELFEKMSYELFLFGALMFAMMVIFAILAYFYKYVTIKTPSTEEVEITTAKDKSNESQGRSNEAYDEDRF